MAVQKPGVAYGSGDIGNDDHGEFCLSLYIICSRLSGIQREKARRGESD
jgi:hypothetical protein